MSGMRSLPMRIVPYAVGPERIYESRRGQDEGDVSILASGVAKAVSSATKDGRSSSQATVRATCPSV